MIEILEALNTKEAVILSIAAMTVIFSLVVFAINGIFYSLFSAKILRRVKPFCLT